MLKKSASWVSYFVFPSVKAVLMKLYPHEFRKEIIAFLGLLFYCCSQKIMVITFYTSGISAYAVPFIAVNDHYCKVKGYEFYAVTEKNFTIGDQDDFRWNKVDLLIKFMQSYSETYDYFVYWDADLVVLDFSLSISSIASSHPDAHVIMTEDSLDVANSGVIIVKSSEWSLNFLRVWKRMKALPYVYCDQHALNALSLTLAEHDELHSFAVISSHIMNSRWPPIQTYNPHTDKVLHLMGERLEVREAVAQTISTYFLTHFNSVSLNEPLKIELTKQELYVLKENIVRNSITEQLIRINNCDVTLALEWIKYFCAFASTDGCKQYLYGLYDIIGGGSYAGQCLEALILVGLQIIGFEDSLSSSLAILEEILNAIELYEAQSSSMNRGYLLQLQSGLFASLSCQYSKKKEHTGALNNLLIAADLLQEAILIYSTTNQRFLRDALLEYISVAGEIVNAAVSILEVSATRQWCLMGLQKAKALHDEEILERRLTVEVSRSLCASCNSILGSDVQRQYCSCLIYYQRPML